LVGAIRQGRWKLVLEDERVRGLFDLEADPCETRDLSASHPAEMSALRGELARWDADVRRANMRKNPPRSRTCGTTPPMEGT